MWPLLPSGGTLPSPLGTAGHSVGLCGRLLATSHPPVAVTGEIFVNALNPGTDPSIYPWMAFILLSIHWVFPFLPGDEEGKGQRQARGTVVCQVSWSTPEFPSATSAAFPRWLLDCLCYLGGFVCEDFFFSISEIFLLGLVWGFNFTLI